MSPTAIRTWQGDLRFEPRAALVGGADGLDAIRAIVAGAQAHLGPGGWLLFEHGYDQAERCRSLLGIVRLRRHLELAGPRRHRARRRRARAVSGLPGRAAGA